MKPILFNTDMVRALLEERKTVTRRPVQPQPFGRLAFCSMGFKAGTWSYPGDTTWQFWGEEWRVPAGLTRKERMRNWKAPYNTDDILYVRETWARLRRCDGSERFVYKASDTYPFGESGYIAKFRWHPSIHMPKEAARIFLKVTGVRVEQLQTSFFEPICPILTVQDEGIDIGDTCRACIENYREPCCVDTVDEDGSDLYGGECGELDQSRSEFADLWDSTIKPADLNNYGWRANPWVWVISFERCEKPALI